MGLGIGLAGLAISMAAGAASGVQQSNAADAAAKQERDAKNAQQKTQAAAEFAQRRDDQKKRAQLAGQMQSAKGKKPSEQPTLAAPAKPKKLGLVGGGGSTKIGTL